MNTSTHPQFSRSAMAAACAVIFLAACGEVAKLPSEAGVGPNPALPAPTRTLLPTMHIAPAKGWPDGVKPIAAGGTAVAPFATGLSHPRWLYVLPNGDVLVAETNAPPKPDDRKGIKGWVMGKVMAKAGAGTPSANRITLLRDTDGDGIAETRTVLIEGLNSPFGMALVGSDLYIANSDAVVKVPYRDGDTKITATPVKVADLPAGTINHHWTKNIIASADGAHLYATVGSNSNVASGLRNPNGMAWEPGSGTLWTVANERDELGSDLVPDYLTSVKDGGFYGWPYSYYGAHVDDRVSPQRPDLVASAIAPDYALGSHVAALGLVRSDGAALPFGAGMYVGEHGSWNRNPRSGYKVVFVPFAGGKPAGQPRDVLTGFVNDAGDAYGRPVGVAVDKRGALLVADDVGNVVWRVTGTGQAMATAAR